MKLVIVAWGEVGNNIVTAAVQEFRNQGVDTSIVGILRCKDESNPTKAFRERMVEENPDVVLWWFWACEFEFIQIARKALPKSRFVMFNWDDPYCWACKLNRMAERLAYFDMALACSSEKLAEYRKVVPSSYLYFPPFSPRYHEYDYDEKYACDVSFICTNLYGDKDTFPNQFIDRRSLLQAFENSSLDFHLYGPESIKDAAPTSYKGRIDFAVNRKVFSSSKINLCTHVIIAQDYLNERVVTCLASKGLLLTDPTPGLGGFLEDGGHVVTMKSNDPEQVVKQAEEIVANIKEYEKVKESGKEIIQRQHLRKWVGGIVEKLSPTIVVLMHGYSKEAVDSLATSHKILVACDEDVDDPRIVRVCQPYSEPHVTFNKMLEHTDNSSIIVLWHKDMRMGTEGWDNLLKDHWYPRLLRYHTASPLTVITNSFVHRFQHVAYAAPIYDWAKDISCDEDTFVDIRVEGYTEAKDDFYDSKVMQDIRKSYQNKK